MKNSIYSTIIILFISVIFYASSSPFSERGILDLNNLYNYANQPIPPYITKDNTPPDNPITDAGATLGRVLFYDKNLSVNNQISCASCHQQKHAFSDPDDLSIGVAGNTKRHSMRLINARFSEESKFFWDERASSLEMLITMPIQDHIEMGFSGKNGDPPLDSLLNKLATIAYYPTLFEFAFGSPNITEERLQKAMAQFIRSIQSFDAPYDKGRRIVNNDFQDFPNFSESENWGKSIFMTAPIFNDIGERIGGGAGCANCHRPPEFDIDPDSGNNGVVINLGKDSIRDFSITRSPSLRTVCNEQGQPYGGFMHNASMGIDRVIYDVTKHYGEEILEINENLDHRLKPNGYPQKLFLSVPERKSLGLFIRTLKGVDIFTNPKWSTPFDENQNLTLKQKTTSTNNLEGDLSIQVYPNPAQESFFIKTEGNNKALILKIYNQQGQVFHQQKHQNSSNIPINNLPKGIYLLKIYNQDNRSILSKKLIKI